MIKISKRQAEKNKKLEKIKEKLPKVCVICGNPGNDLAHLLNKQLFPEHYTEPKNLVILSITSFTISSYKFSAI